MHGRAGACRRRGHRGADAMTTQTATAAPVKPAPPSGGGITRLSNLPLPLQGVALCLAGAGLFLFLWYTFSWKIAGMVLEQIPYYYLLYATFGTCVFLLVPAWKGARRSLPWYDALLAAFVFGACVFLTANSYDITRFGWVPPPNAAMFALALVLTIVSLDAGRRIGGWVMAGLCLLFGVYPLFADYMPGFLYGFGADLPTVVGQFAYGRIGMLGMPVQVTGEILVGYLIFAAILMATGAGQFFIDLAMSLLGRFRGGPAKVAVLTSALFGMMSGSPTSCVVTIGTMTVPQMVRMGYPNHYAAAVSAVAANGTMVMPPVMGSIAFLMAVLTSIPYAEIALMALIPAILYYAGLVVQADGFAAKSGLKGLPAAELPRVWPTLKEGWPFLVVIVFLGVCLLYFRWSVEGPIYAAGLAVALSYFNRRHWMTPARFKQALVNTAETVTFLIGILMPCGLLMIGLDITGSLTAVTAQIVGMAQNNVLIVLVLAAVLSYLLGFIGLNLVPYIVLAVTALPAIVKATGMDLGGMHLFIIYWLITGGITPPVAIIAFVAAAVAGAPPMKTGWTATRLAVVVYFIPFVFVFNKALLFQGPLMLVLLYFLLALAGVWVMCSGLEGYLIGIGKLPMWSRPFLAAAGLFFALPDWYYTVGGVAVAAAVIAILLVRKALLRRQTVTT
jgi:TRAP transporter 4TM/12TM fusion protein